MNWTEEQLAQHMKKSPVTYRADAGAIPPTPSKYKNLRCEWQGEKFDSKHEMEDWILLKAREAAGEIRSLDRQVPFSLSCPMRIHGQLQGSIEVCQYIADFFYEERVGDDSWLRVVQDSKGYRTREYRLKRNWLMRQEGITIRET